MESRIIKPGMVIVDKREARSQVPSLLAKYNVSVRYDLLEVGDYALAGDILIERKSINDFISSLLDGRLFEQASALVAASSNPTMLVEGDLHKALSYFKNVNAFWGAYASLIYDFKLITVYTSSPEETARFISVISKRKKEEKTEMWVKPKKKKGGTDDILINVLTSIPNVGVVTADRLLTGLGTLREIFNADPQTLSTVGKIPHNKSHKIYEIINTKYSKFKGGEQLKIG
ncbi:MAG: ERCC4 domain-containing protein [Nitrososphaerota archaeon]